MRFAGLGRQAVKSVHGRLGHVVGSGGDYSAALVDSLGPSNVQADLDALFKGVGTAVVITSQDDLEAHFPNAAGVHTVNLPTIWTAPADGGPIALLSGRSVSVEHPGSILGLGIVTVTVTGDVVGGLFVGELRASGLNVANINAAGWDYSIESLLGRPIVVDVLNSSGNKAGFISNIMGGGLLATVSMVPPVSALAEGFKVTGVIGNIRVQQVLALPPGVVAYTVFALDALTTVVARFNLSGCQVDTSNVGDSLIKIDPGATLPTGTLPTTVLGMTVRDNELSGPGSVFGVGLDNTDIRVFASGNLGGRSSRFLGQVEAATTTSPAIQLTHSGVGVDDIIPYDNASNGGAGPTLVTLVADVANKRFTLDVTDPDPQVWYARYDGTASVLNGNVSYIIDVARTGAGATISVVLLRSQALGPYLPIEPTRSLDIALLTVPQRIVGASALTVGVGDRFDVAIRTSNVGTKSDITFVTVKIEGTL